MCIGSPSVPTPVMTPPQITPPEGKPTGATSGQSASEALRKKAAMSASLTNGNIATSPSGISTPASTTKTLGTLS